MMNQKDKANDLVSKYYSLISGMELSFISKLITMPSGDSHYQTAKECALLAVDELISDNEHNEEIVSGGLNKIYWQEVKSELEKL